MLYIITLKIMLASCTERPVDDNVLSGRHEGEYISQSNEIVIDNSNSETRSIYSRQNRIDVSVGSDFQNSIVVELRNASDTPFILSLNYGATSRLKFYSRDGQSVENGGFEGRPEREARIIDAGEILILQYDSNMFAYGSLQRASRVCFQFRSRDQETNFDPGEMVCVDRD